MAYNAQIPQPTDQMSVSQTQILPNFQEIATAFNANHVNFNTGSVEGMHDFVQFPTGVPTQTTNAPITGQVALYSNTGSASGVPELFFQRANLGANAGYSITEFVDSTYPTATPGNGWTRMPSGFVVCYGTATSDNFGSQTISFEGSPPSFTIKSVQLTPLASSNNNTFKIYYSAPQSGGFQYWVDTSSSTKIITFEYLVIGI